MQEPRSTTRYSCPLECGWHYDTSGPGVIDIKNDSDQNPGETLHDFVERVTRAAMRAHTGTVNAKLAEHLNTHTMPQAVVKLHEQREEILRLRRQLRECVRNVDGGHATTASSRPPFTTHSFAGHSKERAQVGLPGHCERCAEVGHVKAHPSLGCGDVGCNRSHETTKRREARS